MSAGIVTSRPPRARPVPMHAPTPGIAGIRSPYTSAPWVEARNSTAPPPGRARATPVVFCYGEGVATFIVMCPCCGGRLTVDGELEAVIAHEAPPRPKSGVDLGGALSSLKGEAARREERFREQLKAEKSKGKVLDRMFQEGLKRAKDSPDPPINPMELD
jgi:Zn-finger nucleic acid-binding protein